MKTIPDQLAPFYGRLNYARTRWIRTQRNREHLRKFFESAKRLRKRRSRLWRGMARSIAAAEAAIAELGFSADKQDPRSCNPMRPRGLTSIPDCKPKLTHGHTATAC